MKRADVVTAAIVDAAGRVLLAKRSADATYPRTWATPGGKVHEGETERDALARELREEIGIELVGKLGRVVYEHETTSSRTNKPILIRCYLVRHEDTRGVAKPLDKTSEVYWFWGWNARKHLLSNGAPADKANAYKIEEVTNG